MARESPGFGQRCPARVGSLDVDACHLRVIERAVGACHIRVIEWLGSLGLARIEIRRRVRLSPLRF
jgi:hypothetical protein